MVYQRDLVISGAMCIAAILMWIWSAPSRAQEPLELSGPVGCTLHWNYPDTEIARVQAFPIIVNDARYRAKPDARSIACADIGMSEPGVYALRLFAKATDESGWGDSPQVLVTVTLTPGAIGQPTDIRLTLGGSTEKPI